MIATRIEAHDIPLIEINQRQFICMRLDIGTIVLDPEIIKAEI